MTRHTGSRQTLLTGRRALSELLKSSPARVKELFVVRGAKLDRALEQLILSLPKNIVRYADRSVLDEMSNGTPHQGVVAYLEDAPELSSSEVISRDGSGIVVVLDEINDPQNLGALLRVSEISGAQGVLVTERRTAPLSPTVRKASVGASELLPLARVKNLQRAIAELKENGFWVVGTGVGEGAIPLPMYRFPEKVAIILGSEGDGMRRLTTRECDELVSIPMFGKLSSLNVSQAAAIILYEVRRQRGRDDSR